MAKDDTHFEVRYRVVTGIDGSTVSEDVAHLDAATEDAARAAAVAWVHDNDPAADPRIDPRVVIDSVDVDDEHEADVR